MIKLFSSDDLPCLEQAVNAWMIQCKPKNARSQFRMIPMNEEESLPGERPKKGGQYAAYGICVEYDEDEGEPCQR